MLDVVNQTPSATTATRLVTSPVSAALAVDHDLALAVNVDAVTPDQFRHETVAGTTVMTAGIAAQGATAEIGVTIVTEEAVVVTTVVLTATKDAMTEDVTTSGVKVADAMVTGARIVQDHARLLSNTDAGALAVAALPAAKM